ncbi:MAG: CotH kinase family protein [Janthinobacterium lividum]
MHSPFTSVDNRKVLFILFLLLGAGRANAQSVLAVKPIFFHRDSVKHLLLINAPLAQVNAQVDTLKTIVSGKQRYTLAHPVASVNCQTAYQVFTDEVAYTAYFTPVPVLHLNTRHQIKDTPSVYATLALADTTGLLAQSGLGIEIRGGWSQTYPKKSYELTLWADTTGAKTQDAALLGMRSDKKWNLQAMYNDPLRLRLKLANELWQDMSPLYYQAQEPSAKNSIALAYTEVFLNDSYQGIYTLTERIDRKQLKLKKYTTKIMGELYKGADWAAGATTFSRVPDFDNSSTEWGGFEYKEPSEETDWTALHSFVDFVVNSSDTDFYSQYRSKFNLASAVDYYIFLNLMRATDNTGKNVYIAKYKPGEPYYYVPWDLDGVLGNDWQGLNVNITNDLLSNGLYNRLLQDNSPNGFRATLSTRWSALRASVLTPASILARLKQHSDYLLTNKVYDREHLAWHDYAYQPAQLTYPAEWLTRRLAYLDGVFTPSSALSTQTAASLALFELYPNPASGSLRVAFGASPFELSIQDLTGKTVLRKALSGSNNQLDISALPQGAYLVRVHSATAVAVRKLLVR